MKKFLQAKISVQKSGDVITVIASDETLDRHGEVLPIDQWDLKSFNGSPRMLVDHDHQVASIVGRWTNARVVDGKLLMDADFHDFTPLAKAVKQMVEEGYLNTVSVGFIPHGPKKDGGKESFELIETSWVTVPANPSAMVLNAMKSLDGKVPTEADLAKVKSFIDKDGDEPADLESSDDALPEDEEEETTEEEVKAVMTAVEQFKEFPDTTEVIAVEYGLLKQLISDSEQLKTLTADKQAKVEAAKRQKLLRLSLKAVASHTSHLLREMNKNSD